MHHEMHTLFIDYKVSGRAPHAEQGGAEFT